MLTGPAFPPTDRAAPLGLDVPELSARACPPHTVCALRNAPRDLRIHTTNAQTLNRDVGTRGPVRIVELNVSPADQCPQRVRATGRPAGISREFTRRSLDLTAVLR